MSGTTFEDFRNALKKVDPDATACDCGTKATEEAPKELSVEEKWSQRFLQNIQGR